MKNTQELNKISSCYECKLKGFFCKINEQYDILRCPCCDSSDFLNYYYCFDMEYNDKYKFLFDEDYEDDMRVKYYYCNYCNIIYKQGCLHKEEYLDHILNCHFIKRWRNKSNNIEYFGMPQFENIDDWFNNVNDVEVLELYCPHKGAICSKDSRNKSSCDLSIN